MIDYQKNNKSFNDIVKGRYGRKIAYTDVREITPDNVKSVIAKTEGIFNMNKMATRYLWHYYLGDQPILYRIKEVRPEINNKVVENHAEEIVKFKTGQTYGEPIQYVSRRNDMAINEAVDRLNEYMLDAGKRSKDITHGEWQSATGTSFLAVQMSNGDIPFKIVVPTPMNTYVIYSRQTQEPMLAVQECLDAEGQRYKICYSKGMQFEIKNGVVSSGLHTFGDIPIVEYPNNAERVSDIEVVITILDAINTIDSNRTDGIEQFVQALMIFKNCAIDEETFHGLRQAGGISIKSSRDMDADIKMLTEQLNQSETQVAKNDMWEMALSILGIPNKQSNTGGDTQGAVELRNGWDFAKSRARLKDPYVADAEKRFARLVLTLVNRANHDCNITTRDFDVCINHSPADNIVVKCQSLEYLLKCGIAPIHAIKTIGLWGDAEKVYIDSKPYLDGLYNNTDHDTKVADLFVKYLNAGMSITEACKKVGYKENTIDSAKWTVPEVDETIEVVE